uniref:BLTX531 n=1 Tax=Nephila pilipes TaxID=299642 RepID=A0A076KU58_NEPPI|nr:BLTX531 [Nephila pilipes]
MCFTLFSET